MSNPIKTPCVILALFMLLPVLGGTGTYVHGTETTTQYYDQVELNDNEISSHKAPSGIISDPFELNRASQEDMVPPEVILLTTPRTIVGSISFKFTGSIDLVHVEIEYYNDSNGNGLKDDEGWMPAANGTPKGTSWDTTIGGGGPGEMGSMFLRFRGKDEVPNISPWSEVDGFSINSTGPSSVEVLDPPDRVTNVADQPLLGKAEKNGYVMVQVNGNVPMNRTCNGLGVFIFDLNLTEGHNDVSLIAYNDVGAGLSNRTYEFTLDTKEPQMVIDVGQETTLIREINWEGYPFISTSIDLGTDDNFTFLDNVTWAIIPPVGYPKPVYGTEELKLAFEHLGSYNITLMVVDPAGNWNSTWVRVQVQDTTAPNVGIDGPIVVDEKTGRTYKINVTDNDPSWFSREGSTIVWDLTGPEVQMSNSTQPTITVSFPLPGTYGLGLWVQDGGGNNGSASIAISAKDKTSPSGAIIGPSSVELGVPASFSCNVTDNDDTFPVGASYLWNLTYVDAPPDQIWSRTFDTLGFSFNFTEPGFYTLTLLVSDASGNELSLLLNIEAIGDLVHPTIIDHYPPENPDHQFREDLKVSVTFSEKMMPSSFTGDSINVVDDLDAKINFTYDLLDGTILSISPEELMFGRTYTFSIGPNVADLWGNKVGSSFSVSYRIRNFFELDFPDGVFPSSMDDNFTGNETGFYKITMKFTNPVQVQTLIGSITLTAYKTILKDGKERIEKQEVSDYSVIPGNDSYSAIVVVQLDMGVKYEISISKDIRDIYDYPLDLDRKWSFKTYLPPDNRDDGPDNDDDNGIPDWMEDPTTWVITAFIIIIIIVLLVVLMLVRRSSRKKKLEKMWNETSKEGPRRRSKEPPVEPAPEVPEEIDQGLDATIPSSGELYEQEPEKRDYSDLYGDVPIVTEPETTRVKQPPVYSIPDQDEDYIPPPPSIDWDEDKDEEGEEEWGDDETEEEESWEK